MAICHDHGKSKDGLYTIYMIDIFFLSCHHHLLHGSCVVCKVMGLLLLIFVQAVRINLLKKAVIFHSCPSAMPLAFELLQWCVPLPV